jgi:glioma pathogenesis-related protein 2
MKIIRGSAVLIGAGAVVIFMGITTLPVSADWIRVMKLLGRSPYWAAEFQNYYRDKHCVPQAQAHWNSTLAIHAQDWANRCTFSHSPSDQRPGEGENLYWATPAQSSIDTSWAADRWWYDENAQYDYNNPGFSPATGHFTQMVWKDTTSIGCGHAQCGGTGYWVCRYSPPGNWLGQFPQNVPPPCK